MSRVDDIWQNFIEAEKLRLMSLPVEELLTLDFCTIQFVDSSKQISEYGLWHETPEVRGSKVHSFILLAERKLFFCIYRKYLAGFAIDEAGKIVPIVDDVLYSYD